MKPLERRETSFDPGGLRCAVTGELRSYPINHFECFSPEYIDRIANDQIDFLHNHLNE